MSTTGPDEKFVQDPCFPGLIQSNEIGFRFSNKSIQENERIVFSNYWREQINMYGTQVSYFVNAYNILSADNFYGEDTTRMFAQPRNIIIAATLNENAINLSKFGFDSDDEITAYVHIDAYYDTFYTLSTFNHQYDLIEPKAGDVFQLSEYGDDRPGNRQPKYFEITERIDEDIAQMNQLGGHYVFLIKAKRLDYSFEPNVPFDNLTNSFSGNSQVYEGSFAGRLSGGENEESKPKKENYDEYDIDNISKNDVFDMSINDTDVYGDYY